MRNLVSLLTVLILRKSDFCFSAGPPFPLYSTGTAELRCCYQKYISYLLVTRYIMLQVLFMIMMMMTFIFYLLIII